MFLYRIGRSSYAHKGIVINICDSNDMSEISNLIKFYRTRIQELPADISDIIQADKQSLVIQRNQDEDTDSSD